MHAKISQKMNPPTSLEKRKLFVALISVKLKASLGATLRLFATLRISTPLFSLETASIFTPINLLNTRSMGIVFA